MTFIVISGLKSQNCAKNVMAMPNQNEVISRDFRSHIWLPKPILKPRMSWQLNPMPRIPWQINPSQEYHGK